MHIRIAVILLAISNHCTSTVHLPLYFPGYIIMTLAFLSHFGATARLERSLRSSKWGCEALCRKQRNAIASQSRALRSLCSASASGSDDDVGKYSSYNQWIAEQQKARNQGATSSRLTSEVSTSVAEDTSEAPPFPNATLFHDGAEEYALAMTTTASADFARIAAETDAAALFAPCMVGQIEGQFLKMMAFASRAKRVLEIGTFTGYAALAFAEGLPDNGEVVTIEVDPACAAVARKCFAAAQHGAKITLVEMDAKKAVADMVARGDKFDIVFLDADKVNYALYYEAGLKMLNEGGVLMADNALCSLVYAADDPVRKSLHGFNQMVRRDPRVEQVMLTVREGVLVARLV